MDLKKIFLTLGIISILLIPVSIGTKVDYSGSVLTVGDGGYSSIQEAINAANHGDEIIVLNGTYYENIVVNKSVKIQGEDIYNTFIDAGGFGHALAITMDNVTINGFTIQNSGPDEWDAAIRVSANNSHIFNNRLINNTDGISLIPSCNSTINDNYIENGLAGIDVYGLGVDAVGNNISENYLVNITYAIWIGFAHNNEISKNKFIRNRYAIMMEDSYDNVFSQNYFKDNHLNARFTNDSNNIWKNNFWDRPRFLPYFIFGYKEIGIFRIPMINIDWKPMFVSPLQ